MFNKESERYLSDDHRKNGDQAFESALVIKGQSLTLLFRRKKLKSDISF